MTADPIEHFRLAIAAVGIEAPDSINANGAIHRFNTNGRRGDDSGWYMLHTDGIAAGAFGCWRTGLQSTWCAKSDNAMTATELDTHRQRIKAPGITFVSCGWMQTAIHINPTNAGI